MQLKPSLSTPVRRLPNMLGMLLAGCLAGSLAQAATAIDPGVITLYGKTGDVQDENNPTSANCTIVTLPAGSDRSIELHLNNPGSTCYGLRVSSIALSNMPSATEVLLTDDHHCSTHLGDSFDLKRDPGSNQNFWIRLKTSGAGATLPEESISALTEKGYFSKVSPTGALPKGIRIMDFGLSGPHSRMTYTLSCIRITTSADDDTQHGADLSFASGSWQTAVEESKSIDWTCPQNQVMTARKHEGDENGDTQYKCAPLTDFTPHNPQWSTSFAECGINLEAKYNDDEQRYKNCDEAEYNNNTTAFLYFTCPVDQVMTGRDHKGNERGQTRYQCAALYKGTTPDKNNLVTVLPGRWSDPIKESDSEYACPANQVMVGRAHRGDENNETRYMCATLRAPAN